MSNNEDQYLGKYLTSLLHENTDIIYKILHQTIVNEGAFNIESYIKLIYHERITSLSNSKDSSSNSILKSVNTKSNIITSINTLPSNTKEEKKENPEKSTIKDNNISFPFEIKKKK